MSYYELEACFIHISDKSLEFVANNK